MITENGKQRTKNKLNLAVLITLIATILVLLFLGLGTYILSKNGRISNKILKQNPFVKKTPNENCINIIESKSINKLPDDKINAECKDAIKSLGDEYSTYFEKEDYKKFIDGINNTYTGVGIAIEQIKIDETNTTIGISKVFANTPAEQSGLKIGDKITAVNGETTNNLKTEEVSKKIRGPVDTEVKLKIKSGDIEGDKNIIRKKVEIPNIDIKKLDNIAFISIQSFSTNLYDDFYSKTKELRKDTTINTIVLDLRGNGGGSLNASVDLISAFTQYNTHAVSEVKKDSEEKLYTRRDPLFKNIKLIIAGNEGTASASEITMIALKEKANAKLIGKKTFGKGVVQQIEELENGDAIKITVAEWTSPDGYKINKKGIIPDIELDLLGPLNEGKILEEIKKI
jgi:carboxyl-terminal processing protease